MSKKSYSKPNIFFQPLMMNDDVSSPCEIQSLVAMYECPVWVEDIFTIINEGVCDSYGPETTDMICYHVPFTGQNVFGS